MEGLYLMYFVMYFAYFGEVVHEIGDLFLCHAEFSFILAKLGVKLFEPSIQGLVLLLQCLDLSSALRGIVGLGLHLLEMVVYALGLP